MLYHCKKPGAWLWTPHSTLSLAADAKSGKVGTDWRFRPDGDTRNYSLAEVLQKENPGRHPVESWAGLDADASSSTSGLVDVATRASGNAISFGVIHLLIGGGAMALLMIALSAINWERSRGINEITGIMTVMATISAIAAWLLLATAVRRFRAAFQSNCYFRAGSAGFSFRIPGSVTWSSLLFGYRISERHLGWEEVKKWYPYVHTINGIPSNSAIVIETVGRGTIAIPTMHFAESRGEIVDKINRAVSRGS